MIDRRCQRCSNKDIDLDSDVVVSIPVMEYQGKGIFKCPECGDIKDVSSGTYSAIIAVNIYGDANVIKVEGIKGDDFPMHGAEMFADDISELGPEDLSRKPGIYRCDVYWKYNRISTFEGEEWNLDIEVLKSEKIDIELYVTLLDNHII